MSVIFKYALGTKVRDTITGYEGTITARVEWLNGCIRYVIERLEGGDVKELTFDEQRLEVVKVERSPVQHRTGGGRSTPPRTGH